MARFGLCGPSYQSQSPAVDPERCVNLYPEMIESLGKSQVVLYPTPGKKLFCTLSDTPVRGEWTFLGRTFAVAGTSFYEVFGDGSFTKYGTVANDGTPVTMETNQANQLAICSGGSVYIFNLLTNVLSAPVGGMLATPVQLVFCDGYFLVLLNDGRFQISALLDGTSWPGLQVVEVSVVPERPSAIFSDHREVWLASTKHCIGYYNSGSTSIFDPIGPAAFIESGVGAPFSPVRMDNSIFWLEASERGGGVARRANGYTPVRVSNHAVEFQWSLYPTLMDAIGYSYIDQGHTFWALYFPSANATWVYDAATQMWHERGFWNTLTGSYTADRSRCHVYCFGKHLVGDWASGKIYDQSIAYYDDSGVNDTALIRRMRISPPISYENEWVHHQQLQIDVEAGLGPLPPLLDGAGNARDPQLMLSWSNDGGHTYTPELTVGCGQAGAYTTRAMFRRLGRSRVRSYKLVMTDPIPWRIIEGDLKATPGFTPMERLTKQFQKIT